MNPRLLLGGLVFSFALRPAPLPNVPLGFEHNGSVFSAQSDQAQIDVDAQGFSLHSAIGSVRISTGAANPEAAITGHGNAGTRNWFIGNDPTKWITGVPLFDRVNVPGIYPGIDLSYYGVSYSGRSSHLEYDFTISPHGDPNRIVLQVSGAESLTLDPQGNLQINLAAGQLTEHPPDAYQMMAGRRHPVESRFVIQANARVRFAIGDYDRSLPLIIDPVVAYSSYLGGTATDEGHAIAVDSSGNYFVAGRTFSTPDSNSHVLVLELLAAGGTVESIFGGTSGNDTANAIAVDSSGNVYLAGSTSSPDYPVGGENVYQDELVGTQNAFVTALAPGISTVIFSTFIGGDLADEALGIAVGPNDNLYIVGDTESTNFSLISSSAFQITNHGGFDAFLFSLTTAGVANFGTYLGGSGNDYAYGVAVDSSGNVYVVGATTSTDYPASPYPDTPEPFQLTNHGTENAFAIEFYPNGEDAYWSTYIGGENADAANAVALDAAGNVYIGGTTGSTQFPVSTGAYQTTYQGGGSDGFVVVLQNNGQYGVWSTYLGGELADTINALALDSSNNIIVTGSSNSLGFPVTADAVQSTNAGGQDVILATLSNAGNSLLFSTYFGGSGNDDGTGVAVDATGHIYITGITASSNNDFPITSGAFQPTYGGGSSDAFFSVFGCSSAVPTIGTGGIVNAASSLASAIAPGGIISIYGTNMGCTPSASSAVPLPTSLGAVSVQVNGKLIPLFYVGETQINAQLPYETATGTATVTVTGPGGTSTAASISVVAAAPGIFEINGQAAALNSDGTLNTPTNPAKVGSYISVYFTGQGPVSQPIVTGAAAAAQPPYINVTSSNSATIGGSTSTVYFMGLASGLVGLAQANLEIPNLTTGNYSLVITIDGLASAAATVSVTQ